MSRRKPVVWTRERELYRMVEGLEDALIFSGGGTPSSIQTNGKTFKTYVGFGSLATAENVQRYVDLQYDSAPPASWAGLARKIRPRRGLPKWLQSELNRIVHTGGWQYRVSNAKGMHVDIVQAYRWAQSFPLPNRLRSFKSDADPEGDWDYAICDLCLTDKWCCPPFKGKPGETFTAFLSKEDRAELPIHIWTVRKAYWFTFDTGIADAYERASIPESWRKQCYRRGWGSWASPTGHKLTNIKGGKVFKKTQYRNHEFNPVISYAISARVRRKVYADSLLTSFPNRIHTDGMHVDDLGELVLGDRIGDWRFKD